MKKSRITALLVFVFLWVSAFAAPLAFSAPETDVLLLTLSKLRSLGEAISAKWNSDGGSPSTPVYPEGYGMPCEVSAEYGAPCWAYPIAGVSDHQAYGVAMMEDIGGGPFDKVEMQGLRGDIRFRCRTQGHQTYCFAYHCLDLAPAGCRQVWRIEWNVKGYHLLETPAKCVKTMPGDAIEVCASWFNPDPSSW